MNRKTYPSDLKDQEWAWLEPLIPAVKSGGRQRTTSMREVLNGIFYVLKTGCQWDMLPHDLPPKGTVYHDFNQWCKDGTLERMNAKLRVQVRLAAHREESSGDAFCHSQTGIADSGKNPLNVEEAERATIGRKEVLPANFKHQGQKFEPNEPEQTIPVGE